MSGAGTGPTPGAPGGIGRLWLVRHEPARAPANACVGWLDLPLAAPDAARTHMQRLAQHMGHVDQVYASDLVRAHDTATYLAAALGCPLQLRRGLRELSFGAWEGLTWAQIQAADRNRYARFMTGWHDTPTPHGESYAALATRVAEVWNELSAEALRAQLAVVAHAGSLRVLAGLILGWSPDEVMARDLHPGHAGLIELDPREPALVRWNWHPDDRDEDERR
ncbi:histidine phosphatase family protein [Haliangium sp.]|uniref:histidine phosphatase family protein n=1 Tax=Haliangium sp. TaxID=2663208 RepID=UPI003D0CE25A